MKNRRFLSTLSLRRATPVICFIVSVICLFLSTLSLRRATIISPHSAPDNGNFYPRSPCGERLSTSERLFMPSHYFYPRSPCGERLVDTLILTGSMLFLSTLSLRRATNRGTYHIKRYEISIHALLAESDMTQRRKKLGKIRFLSTLSLRRATCSYTPHSRRSRFLSTLSLRRATMSGLRHK